MTTPRIAQALTAVLAMLFFVTVVPASAAAPEPPRNITAQFAGASLPVETLQAFEVGGIVVLRGRTPLRSAAEAAGQYAQRLGYTRVANLIQVIESPNDVTIRRDAERELAIHPSLDGSRISVESENGIVYLRGSVQHPMQKDMAVAVLRNVDGVREIRDQLERE